MNEDSDNKYLDLGKLIRDRLEENGQAVSWLAKKINTERSNCYRILDRKNLNTQLLMDISRVLNFDFFACLSEHFQETKQSVAKNSTICADNNNIII